MQFLAISHFLPLEHKKCHFCPKSARPMRPVSSPNSNPEDPDWTWTHSQQTPRKPKNSKKHDKNEKKLEN